jgi:uncharacterized protein (TIGR03437 family)
VLVDGTATSVFYSSATQINFLMPGKVTPESSSRVQFNCNGLSSQPMTIPIASVAPAIFTATQDGQGQAAIVNQDNSIDTSTPAGTYIQVYGTGFGSYNSKPLDGLLRLVSPVTATLGGLPVTVLYAGEAPGYTLGLQQINVGIPASAATGLTQLVLTIGSPAIATQVGVTLNILPTGAPSGQ